MTVLFADLVGFTTLAESRDAELFANSCRAISSSARKVTSRYGGTVEKFIGDAVMAVGRADRARRRRRTRRPRRARPGRRRQSARCRGIQARAGVLTGEAAVTIGATNQGLVAGDIVNTGVAPESVAAPGTVLVGEQTEQAANSAIAFEPAGEQGQGQGRRVPRFRAIRVAERGGRGRSDQIEAPFVGRDDQFRLLRDVVLTTARDKRPRLVSITGVPGVGKSRMAWELSKYIDGLVERIYWHQGRSPSYGEGCPTPGARRDGPGPDRVGRGRRRGQRHQPPGRCASVAGFDQTERRWIEHALLSARPRGQCRRRTRGAVQCLAHVLRADRGQRARRPPVRGPPRADAGLLDFIDHVLDWSTGVPLSIVTLARPELIERRPAWGIGRRTFIGLALEPLPDDAMGEILAALAPGLPADGRATIITRADGIPLYAVETVRMLVAAGPIGSVHLADLAIPATLQALIAARLDALDPADRSLICDAAVRTELHSGGSRSRQRL